MRTVTGLRDQKAVIAKLGFDAHWRGVIVVANALRDAGMEVVYVGHATAEQIARTAAQEDAILVGLSTLSGNHLDACPDVLHQLAEHGVDDVVVVLGGTIPAADIPVLQEAGVDAVFPTGSAVPALVERIEELVTAEHAQRTADALPPAEAAT